MTKQAKAVAVETATEVDQRITQFLTRERSPADAGREAGLEAFDGLGADIMAFVKQRFAVQRCVDQG
jgi:hypothetical protein